MKGKTFLYIPLGIKEFMFMAWKPSKASPIMRRHYKKIEEIHDGVTEAIQKGADFITLRVIKEEIEELER